MYVAAMAHLHMQAYACGPLMVHVGACSIWREREHLHNQWCDLVCLLEAPGGVQESNTAASAQGPALWAILGKLQENLKTEQVAYCQQHHLVFRQLLSHTQVRC